MWKARKTNVHQGLPRVLFLKQRSQYSLKSDEAVQALTGIKSQEDLYLIEKKCSSLFEKLEHDKRPRSTVVLVNIWPSEFETDKLEQTQNKDRQVSKEDFP